MRRLCLSIVLLFWAGVSWAVEPHEMLDDPALEARAQALDELLRCVVCRSENIASSRSDWASDARILLREQIAAGATDEEALTFFQERYGDYVLMDPPRAGSNLVLWAAGPVVALIGLIGAGAYVRSRRQTTLSEDPEPLSAEESKRLSALMNKETS